jgi:hypothetical protein
MSFLTEILLAIFFKDTPWKVYRFIEDGPYNAERLHDTNTIPHG